MPIEFPRHSSTAMEIGFRLQRKESVSFSISELQSEARPAVPEPSASLSRHGELPSPATGFRIYPMGLPSLAALLEDDLDESASKLADDVLPTIHLSFSGDMGASGKANRDDRLSNLPDHILLTILDRPDVCGSARTSILSRRWSQLLSMLCQLIISVWVFLPKDVPSFQTDDMVRAIAAVIEVAKSTLARRDSSQNSIHLLSLTFFLGDDDSISIGHVVAQTMATQKVEMSEFTILTEVQSSKCHDDDLVDYGIQFMLFFDAYPDAFGGLTCLSLANLRFCESGISNVLTTCKRLKHLYLANCDLGVSHAAS